MKILITIYRWVIALTIMTITGGVSLLLVLISFGVLRNFCVKHIIRHSSRFILRIMGFKSFYPKLNEFPTHQVLYTFNHNAEQDIFILTGLGLPNLRFILSEKTWIYIPLVISALAAGTRYIPQKKHAKRRLKFFVDTTRFLKRTNYSIAASSEGVHHHFHGIAPFNKGIYRMALEANIPIVPLYINVPEANNMNASKYANNGTIGIEILDEISTKDWTLENLDKHIDDVRKVFVKRFNQLNPDNKTQ
jgi:putative phosphoserine phosphatase/1-acylglycerol-3-phosphate O-acyltransferase